jgi:twitching motility protein PilI
MARKTSLREYQIAVAQRLSNLSAIGTSISSKLGFQAGGYYWFVNLQDVSEVIPVPVIVTVPLTQTYFCGLTNIRGNLYGVVDFSAFMGGAPVTPGMETRLLLLPQTTVQGAALLVNRMAGLRNADGFVAGVRPHDAPAWVKGVFTDADGIAWRELDARKLAEDDRFLNVGR